jgi:hypothetical protein
MKELYPDQWLLIGFTAIDEHLNVIAGEVIAHSLDRDEIYAALDRCKDRSALPQARQKFTFHFSNNPANSQGSSNLLLVTKLQLGNQDFTS